MFTLSRKSLLWKIAKFSEPNLDWCSQINVCSLMKAIFKSFVIYAFIGAVAFVLCLTPSIYLGELILYYFWYQKHYVYSAAGEAGFMVLMAWGIIAALFFLNWAGNSFMYWWDVRRHYAWLDGERPERRQNRALQFIREVYKGWKEKYCVLITIK